MTHWAMTNERKRRSGAKYNKELGSGHLVGDFYTC
jgi:hypothetical protein